VPETDHWAVLERAEDVAALTAHFFTDRPAPVFPALPAPLPAQSTTRHALRPATPGSGRA
jgi:hypothetical protein